MSESPQANAAKTGKESSVAGTVRVAAFYRFAPFSDYQEWRERLREQGNRLGLRGSILLAAEGINGTIAGTADGVEAILNAFRADPRFAELEVKDSWCEEPPFGRWKIKLKREIVTMGVPGIDPCEQVGTYLKPQEWNALLDEPDVVVVDTRNDYEVEKGRFPGAINPETNHFREFPGWADQHLKPGAGKRVAMYCTGGIRCEKATSYLLSRGFREVFHLEGGILKYLETVPPAENRWEGTCYVFDERVSLDKALSSESGI